MVTVKGPDNIEKTMEFDGVICCVGGMREPRMPDMKVSPGYKGRVMHQKDFLDRTIFKDKRVLVIGKGERSLYYSNKYCCYYHCCYH